MAASASPLITVVTPVFNVAPYVAEAIGSVLGQSYRNFECIIVDDGSTDGSLDIVTELAGRDPRLHVITSANGGPSAARNRGIGAARGQFIAFLDADDRWHPMFLQRQLERLRALPGDVGLVFCRSRIILENGTPVFIQWQRSGRYDFDDFLVGMNPARNGSSVLIRRSCFQEVGGFDESLRFGEDLEMWLRIAERSRTPVLWGNPDFLVDLRLRPQSLTRDRHRNDFLLDEFLERSVGKLRRLSPALAYVRPATHALKYGGDPGLTKRWCERAQSVGTQRLMLNASGVRFLFWSRMPNRSRRVLRATQSCLRDLLKSANLRVGALLALVAARRRRR
jgi:glycosyltransferase involved in cell wall biosynthesis